MLCTQITCNMRYLILLMGMMCLGASAQQQACGVYRTATDYEQQQLLPFAHAGAHHHCNSIHTQSLHIVTPQGQQQVPADSIYAIRKCNVTVYRMWQGTPYRLLGSGHINLYARQCRQWKHCRRGHRMRMMPQTVETHYFSIGNKGDIVPLTIGNLTQMLGERFYPHLHLFPSNQSLLNKDEAGNYLVIQLLKQ